MRLLLACALFFILTGTAYAACTGSSPTYSAPDTGNATTNGTNFAACLSAAAAATNATITITLTAGAEYRGNFTIAANSAGSNYITIQSSAVGSLPSGTQVSPASLSNLALITTPNGSPAFTFMGDSHHWKLIGLAITTANSYPGGQRTPSLVTNDNGGSVTYNHWPDSISFERLLIYASEADPLPYRSAEAGISVDGSNITIKDSYIYNFMGWEYPTTIQTVTAATNANPVSVTFSSAHGFSSSHKNLVFLAGATGGWTGLNGLKVATYVDATHATLEDYNTTTFALTNINSTSFGSFSGQTVNRLSQGIAASRALLIQVGPGPYLIDNNFLEAYYTPIFTGGASSTWIDPQNDVTVSAVGSLTQVTLSSVGQLQVGDLIVFSTLQDQAISGATAGTTTSLTVPTMTYPTGTNLYLEGCVTVSGFTGSWAPLNGAWGGNGNGCGSGSVTVIDSTHIRIPVNSSGFGAVTSSSPKWVATIKNNSGDTQWSVGKVTNIAGNVVTYSWWGHQPDNTQGNGAGILVAVGSKARFRGLNLHNLTVTHNTISNRLNWILTLRDVANACDNCSGQPPKASWEAKTADTVLVEGNVFQIEGGPITPHSSTVSMALNQANQIGATPWVSLNNWTIRSNLFKNFTYQIMSLQEEYETGTVSTALLFTNNLLTTANGTFISMTGGTNATITHNTVRNLGTGAGSGGGYNGFIAINTAMTGTVIQDNLANWVLYGYIDNSGSWTPATRNHNYLIDNLSQSFTPPTGDTRIANDAAMGFTNSASADAGGDYHGYQLTSGSVGHNAASDSTDVGVNFTTLDAALAGGGGGGSSSVTVSNVRLFIVVVSVVLSFSLFGLGLHFIPLRISYSAKMFNPSKPYQSVTGPDRQKRLREASTSTIEREVKWRELVRRKK